MVDQVAIRDNLDDITNRIHVAAQSAGRDPLDVHLVVVSKGQPHEVINQAFEAGIRVLGENYPEETVAKINEGNLERLNISWHMIGHLQSRKAKFVREYFSMMHSVDRVSIAEKLDQTMAGTDKKFECLLEVNVSGEASKFGFSGFNREDWEKLTPDFEKVLALPNIEICGLMTMPPLYDDPEGVRPYFVRLRKLQDFLQRRFSESHWKYLSMGTSGDFETAIQEGANYIRIGRAILGPRYSQ